MMTQAMTHALYVASAYGVTLVALGGLLGWIVLDGRAAKRALARLEAEGVRRRSAGPRA